MSRVKVFVAISDDDDDLICGKLCPTMGNSWVEYNAKREACFLHLTLTVDGIALNIWQTHRLTETTSFDQVVDIPLPSICLYPIIFQPETAQVTPARIVRALSKLCSGPSTATTDTSIVFRPNEDVAEDIIIESGNEELGDESDEQATEEEPDDDMTEEEDEYVSEDEEAIESDEMSDDIT